MWQDLPATKVEARRAIRAGRRQRSETVDAAARRDAATRLAELIDQWLSQQPEQHRADDSGASEPSRPVVAAYESLPTEPPTEALLAALAARGYDVLIPILLADNDLDWRVAGPDSTGARGRTSIGEAEVIIVPALAIDRDGFRLGQGGGSYDRALPRRADSAVVVAIVYDDELVERVPRDLHDRRVDAVLTPRGGIRHLATTDRTASERMDTNPFP